MNNILYINDYINELEKQFLEGEDKKYINLCKNIYGVSIDKISINIWTSHIMDEFRENIIKNCKNIDNIDEISKEVYRVLKADRRKIILYSYLKGNIYGYNDYKLIRKFKNIYKDEARNNRKDIQDDKYKEYLNFLEVNKSHDIKVNLMLENIKIYYLRNIEKNILGIDINFNKEMMFEIVEDIIIEEVVKNYNEGILHGILYKINKKALKINKMGL